MKNQKIAPGSDGRTYRVFPNEGGISLRGGSQAKLPREKRPSRPIAERITPEAIREQIGFLKLKLGDPYRH